MCRYLCRVIIQKFSRRTEKFYSTKSRKREQNFRGIAYAYDHFLRGFPSDGFSFLIGLHPLFQRFIWTFLNEVGYKWRFFWERDCLLIKIAWLNPAMPHGRCQIKPSRTFAACYDAVRRLGSHRNCWFPKIVLHQEQSNYESTFFFIFNTRVF